MEIANEAVDAAFTSLMGGGVARILHLTQEDLRAALEAAAPYLIRDWIDGKKMGESK